MGVGTNLQGGSLILFENSPSQYFEYFDCYNFECVKMLNCEFHCSQYTNVWDFSCGMEYK